MDHFEIPVYCFCNPTDLPIAFPAVPLCDQIDINIEEGISTSPLTTSSFDEDGEDGVDPMSDIRHDRFDDVERLTIMRHLDMQANAQTLTPDQSSQPPAVDSDQKSTKPSLEGAVVEGDQSPS